MTPALGGLFVLALLSLLVSLVRARFPETLAAICIGVMSLIYIQGEGPLAALRNDTYTFLAAGGLAVSLLVLYFRSDHSALRDRFVVGCLAAFVLWVIVGGVLGIRLSDQWKVTGTYIAMLLLPFAFPYGHRFLPLYGLVAGAVYQIAVALLGGYYVPTLSGVAQLSAGIQPNILALQAAVVAVVGSVIVVSRPWLGFRWWLGVLLFALGSVAIVLTVSRSGMVALAAAIGVLLLMNTRLELAILGGLAVAFAAVALIADVFRVTAFTDWFVRGDVASLSTLTGRTEIWALALSMVEERPVVGWGFAALYRHDYSGGRFLDLVEGTNAHNVWLQAVVETGVIGMMTLAGVLWGAIRVARVTAPSADKTLLYPLLALLILNSLVSAGFATIGFATFLFGAVISAASWRPEPVDLSTVIKRVDVGTA
ncbi:O-antigen ligase family protein [Kocuria arenosa]|uniref:O-antigen ligase family protein n=1 Tax=Kocuria arenosa TaxID=3071446 RepID=UPI0034D55172